jgi:hypothetical protein
MPKNNAVLMLQEFPNPVKLTPNIIHHI